MSRARDLSRLSNSQAFSVDSNFNVGINTDNPQVELDVSGNANISGNISVGGTITYDDVTNVDSIGIVTARSGVDVGASGSINASILPNGDANFSGRLGLGTTSPGDYSGDTTQLSIAASGSSGLNIVSGITSTGIIRFADGTSGDAAYRGRVEYMHDVDALMFGTAGSERLRITSDGKVGVGTSSPANVLEAAGDNAAGNGIGNVEGILRVNNNTTAFGSSPTAGIVFATKYRTSPDVPLDGAAIYGGKENTADANKSFYLAFATRAESGNNGNEAMRIDSSGNVGIGTASPGRQLQINGDSDTQIRVVSSAGGTAGIQFGDTADTVRGGVNFDNSDNSLQFRGYNNTEGARIDSSGRLLVGTSSNRTNRSLQLEGTTGGASIVFNENGNSGGTFILGKSRGTTNGSFTVVQNDDALGSIIFQGADGTADINGAFIQAKVDGTPGAGDMPTRLVFSTNGGAPDTNATERMQIDSSGQLILSGTRSGNSVNDSIINFNILNSNGDQKKAEIKAIKTGDVSSELIFSTTATHNFAERMRIDSSGRLLVDITSTSRNEKLQVSGGARIDSLGGEIVTFTGDGNWHDIVPSFFGNAAYLLRGTATGPGRHCSAVALATQAYGDGDITMLVNSSHNNIPETRIEFRWNPSAIAAAQALQARTAGDVTANMNSGHPRVHIIALNG